METPDSVSRILERQLRDGDVDQLEELYEPGAVFVDYGGPVVGWAAIRAAHQAFVEEGSVLILDDQVTFEAGDLALVHWSWTVRRPDGSEIAGTSAEVLRHQPDGTWKFVIDNSDGAALIGRL